MITLTPQALDQVKKLIAQEQPGVALRVGVKGGGCSGLTYMMGFDAATREHDQRFEQDGVTIVVDAKSHLYLDGTTIDFQGGLNGQGFAFSNPQAKSSCGCGTSFTPNADASSSKSCC